MKTPKLSKVPIKTPKAAAPVRKPAGRIANLGAFAHPPKGRKR